MDKWQTLKTPIPAARHRAQLVAGATNFGALRGFVPSGTGLLKYSFRASPGGTSGSSHSSHQQAGAQLVATYSGKRNKQPIAIFDSGVGGLSVLKAVRKQHPTEDILYLADQVHIPYGPRPLEEIRTFSEGITRYFLGQRAKLIVVACNTASAAALHSLRETFPQIPFVGMEPAVKPAAEQTESGVVGVLATPATFQGKLYNSVVERFTDGVQVLTDTCPGLVEQIEAGNLNGAEARRILEKALEPMIAKSIDRVVLGCTHYPFVIPLIEEIVGPAVQVIDPAPAIARQVGRLLEEGQLGNDAQEEGHTRLLTTGDAVAFERFLAGVGMEGNIGKLSWGVDLTTDIHR